MVFAVQNTKLIQRYLSAYCELTTRLFPLSRSSQVLKIPFRQARKKGKAIISLGINVGGFYISWRIPGSAGILECDAPGKCSEFYFIIPFFTYSINPPAAINSCMNGGIGLDVYSRLRDELEICPVEVSIRSSCPA